MARPNKLYSKPRVTSIATGDLFSTGQLQADGSYKVKTITKENARAELLAPIEIEYEDLLALSGSYDTEVSYLITNATAASFNLIVTALSATAIGCDARDPLYPNDKIMYNFASNVITWRWDTVRDVSAGEDWRNSNNISIDPTCSKITIGAGCTNITIGENCTNIDISESCTNITIPMGCDKIKVRYSTNIVGLSDFGGSGNVEIDACGALEFDCQVQATKIFAVTTVDFASGSQIEAITGSQIYGQSSGVCRGIYFSGGVLTTYNPAEV